MNVSLTRDLERFVAEKVASGRYTSASEVVREALRLLEERDQLRQAQLAAFDHELTARLDALDRGESVPADQAREHFRRKSDGRRASAA